MTSLRVLRPSDHAARDPDIFISALGYEDRCTYAAREFSATAKGKLALAFRDRMMFDYEQHETWYRTNGFQIVPYDKASIEDHFAKFVDGVASELRQNELDVLIDISSMSRPMLAQIVFFFSHCRFPLTAQFIYCPAQYSPPLDAPLPFTRSEPVTPEYAGWSIRPDLPTSAVVGLGYEYGRALGALEYLEPSVTWAFMPHGEDRRYDRAVQVANADFWNLLPRDRIHEYRVDNPFDCFIRIESLIYGLEATSRPTLVPFGPKMFALVCLLVAELHRPNVTVWRVSGDQAEIPANRLANGKFIRLPVRFSASASAKA